MPPLMKGANVDAGGGEDGAADGAPDRLHFLPLHVDSPGPFLRKGE